MFSPAMMVAMGPVVPSGMAFTAAVPSMPIRMALGMPVLEVLVAATAVAMVAILGRVIAATRSERPPAVPDLAAAA